MTMETFNFPYHFVQDRYPESSTVVQYGKGYRFASKPRAPDQIVFQLDFTAMWFFEDVTYDSYGMPFRVLNANTEPRRNMQRLIEFYERHRMYKKFIYPHPRRGNLTVRFNKPLEVPKVVHDSMGLTESFKVELILEP